MVEVVVEAASSSGTEVKTPRRMRSWVIKPKKRSTPAAPDPRQTARRRSLCSSANYCTIPLKRKSSVSLSTLADYRERVGRRHVLTRRDVEGTVEFIADPPLRGSFRCRLLCCDQVPERAGALLLELLTRHQTWRRTRFVLFLTCTDDLPLPHRNSVARSAGTAGRLEEHPQAVQPLGQ
jgi:hypothetical protein